MPLKFADISFYNSDEYNSAEAVIEAHAPNLKHLEILSQHYEITVYKHLNCNKEFTQNNIRYYFRKRLNSNFLFPIKTFIKIIQNKHDILFIHGFDFCFFVLLLKPFLKGNTKIFLQHHAEKPFSFPKILIQRLADRLIDKYFFVSLEQAEIFIDSKIIHDKNKVVEMMEGSTTFKNKNIFRKSNSFVWVGRLDNNKDPITILKALKIYAELGNEFKLKMIYNDDTLLSEVQSFIENNQMKHIVELVGKVNHFELENIYNENSYFIIGSHKEGSGYALAEAMACGCIPIISNIPSFNKITNNGDCALLFEAGNSDSLFQQLRLLKTLNLENYRSKIKVQFDNYLSFQSIAKTIHENISTNS